MKEVLINSTSLEIRIAIVEPFIIYSFITMQFDTITKFTSQFFIF